MGAGLQVPLDNHADCLFPGDDVAHRSFSDVIFIPIGKAFLVVVVHFIPTAGRLP